jgi:hypothetical protein
MEKMNQEIKAKWVVALRSGEYEQGTGQLRMDDQYCCLGVLCDLHSKEDNTAGWKPSSSFADDFDYHTEQAKEGGLLHPAVRDWAGLDSVDPLICINTSVSENISTLNDGGKTFAEIADLIEAQL